MQKPRKCSEEGRTLTHVVDGYGFAGLAFIIIAWFCEPWFSYLRDEARIFCASKQLWTTLSEIYPPWKGFTRHIELCVFLVFSLPVEASVFTPIWKWYWCVEFRNSGTDSAFGGAWMIVQMALQRGGPMQRWAPRHLGVSEEDQKPQKRAKMGLRWTILSGPPLHYAKLFSRPPPIQSHQKPHCYSYQSSNKQFLPFGTASALEYHLCSGVLGFRLLGSVCKPPFEHGWNGPWLTPGFPCPHTAQLDMSSSASFLNLKDKD